jgi:hypothetical protein
MWEAKVVMEGRNGGGRSWGRQQRKETRHRLIRYQRCGGCRCKAEQRSCLYWVADEPGVWHDRLERAEHDTLVTSRMPPFSSSGNRAVLGRRDMLSGRGQRELLTRVDS